jgi:hypothetical protein
MPGRCLPSEMPCAAVSPIQRDSIKAQSAVRNDAVQQEHIVVEFIDLGGRRIAMD